MITSGPKVTELRKRNNQHPVTIHFSCYKGDGMDRIINEIIFKTGKTKVGLIKDAILYYKVFIDNAIKTDTNNNELKGKQPKSDG